MYSENYDNVRDNKDHLVILKVHSVTIASNGLNYSIETLRHFQITTDNLKIHNQLVTKSKNKNCLRIPKLQIIKNPSLFSHQCTFTIYRLRVYSMRQR